MYEVIVLGEDSDLLRINRTGIFQTDRFFELKTIKLKIIFDNLIKV